jgi:hypothetical protein
MSNNFDFCVAMPLRHRSTWYRVKVNTTTLMSDTPSRDDRGLHEPTSNTMTPKYGTTHACVTALVNLRQCCMPLEVADGATCTNRPSNSDLKRRANQLTNSRDHVALNYGDRWCCTCLRLGKSGYNKWKEPLSHKGQKDQKYKYRSASLPYSPRSHRKDDWWIAERIITNGVRRAHALKIRWLRLSDTS